jgi:hypothetical protein
MRDLIVLVPTRGRPHNIRELMTAFEETETKSDLVAVVADDDETLDAENGYRSIAELEICVVKYEQFGMAYPLNAAARRYMHDYRYFSFLGDDHRPRTKNWDQIFIAELQRLKTGLVYGDDLLQGERLPTAVAMTGDIVRALNGMCPPGMRHLFTDNFWLELGKQINSITYMPNVILEHMHPCVGKTEWTDQYRAVNAKDMFETDRTLLENYLISSDYKKLLENIGHKVNMP